MENEIETDNAVPEITAANPDGGAERLEADPVTTDLHDQLDSLLDAAEQETQPEPVTTNEEIDNQPPVEPVSPPADEVAGQTGDPDGQPTPQDQVLPGQNNGQGTADQRPEIDPEIAQIEQPRNLSEKNQNNWRKLQETASHYKKQAEEAEILRQRLAEAENKPSVVPEDYQELRKFRAIFDIKNDPDFRSTFETPINTAKENIYGILRKHGASDEVIKSIEQVGGPDKVSEKWWQDNALTKLPMLDAEKVKKSLIDVIDLKEKQEKEIAFVAEHAEEVMQMRETQAQNWYQEENNAVRQHVDEITKDFDWARYKGIKGNETEEELAKIQKHNESVAGLESKFSAALWPQNATDRANVAAAAAFSHVLADQLRVEQKSRAEMTAQIKRLTEENSKLKGAYKMPKQSISAQVTNKSNNLSDRIKMNAADAIDMGLDEAGA